MTAINILFWIVIHSPPNRIKLKIPAINTIENNIASVRRAQLNPFKEK
jgi:hypothetical protein